MLRSLEPLCRFPARLTLADRHPSSPVSRTMKPSFGTLLLLAASAPTVIPAEAPDAVTRTRTERRMPLGFGRAQRRAALALVLPLASAACAQSGIMVGGPGVQVGIPMRRAAVFGDTVADRLYFG